MQPINTHAVPLLEPELLLEVRFVVCVRSSGYAGTPSVKSSRDSRS
jgi:hypothetical protein